MKTEKIEFSPRNSHSYLNTRVQVFLILILAQFNMKKNCYKFKTKSLAHKFYCWDEIWDQKFNSIFWQALEMSLLLVCSECRTQDMKQDMKQDKKTCIQKLDMANNKKKAWKYILLVTITYFIVTPICTK